MAPLRTLIAGAAALMAAPAMAAMTVSEVVDSLNSLTSKTQQLGTTVKAVPGLVSMLTSGVVDTGVVNDLTSDDKKGLASVHAGVIDITTTGGNLLNELYGTAQIVDVSDAADIVDAWVGFVDANTGLLDIVGAATQGVVNRRSVGVFASGIPVFGALGAELGELVPSQVGRIGSTTKTLTTTVSSLDQSVIGKVDSIVFSLL